MSIRTVVPSGEPRCLPSMKPLKELGNFQLSYDDGDRVFTWDDFGKKTIVVSPKWTPSTFRVTKVEGIEISGKMYIINYRGILLIEWIFPEVGGVCTIGVARAIQAALSVNPHISIAKTEINSEVPCKAFNCYNRAMNMNGFHLQWKNQSFL